MEFDANSAKEYLQSKRHQPYISDWFRDEISHALESGNETTVVITAYKLRDLIASHEAYEARTTSLAMRALDGFAERVLPKDLDVGKLAIKALVPGDSTDDYYVTLLQMAAVVGGSSKRTIRRMYDEGELPTPDIEGRRGKAHQWRWSVVRPILEKHFARPLPECYPADRFLRS
jgi:hypothetical protein